MLQLFDFGLQGVLSEGGSAPFLVYRQDRQRFSSFVTRYQIFSSVCDYCKFNFSFLPHI